MHLCDHFLFRSSLVTWWFIARAQAYFLSPLTCSPCHVNCECHIKLALKSDKSTVNLSILIVIVFPSHGYFQKPWPLGWLFHTAWFQTALKWRAYMSNPQATIFYKMKTCFGIASNQQTNIKISICMIHCKLNKYGFSCMYKYIQYPMKRLVLLTVFCEPSALVSF